MTYLTSSAFNLYMQAEGDEVVKEDPSPPTDEGKADSGEGGPSGD